MSVENSTESLNPSASSEAKYEAHNVTLAGVQMKLKSPHDQRSIEKIVELVNQKVEEVMSSQQGVSFQKALLLTSLHLADDLISLKKNALLELEIAEERARQILNDLEATPISKIGLDN